MRSLLARAFVIWLLMAAAMVANGALRELLLHPLFGEMIARQFSTLIGATLVLEIVADCWKWLAIASARHAAVVGLFWLVLTLGFEHGMLVYIAGIDRARVLQEYDLTRGHLWPLLLATVAFAPLLVLAVRGTSARKSPQEPLPPRPHDRRHTGAGGAFSLSKGATR